MDVYARNFIRVSLICLVLGLVMGLGMVMHPAMIAYRPVHVHLLLLGFMTNMVFGVGYHIIPRFQGYAVIPRGAATLHLYLSTVGLALMIAGWLLGHGTGGRISAPPGFLLFLGSLAVMAGVGVFLVIIWRRLVPAQRKAV